MGSTLTCTKCYLTPCFNRKAAIKTEKGEDFLMLQIILKEYGLCVFLQYCLIFFNDLQNFEITPKIKTNDPIKAIVWYWCMFMCECSFVYMCLCTFVCVH